MTTLAILLLGGALLLAAWRIRQQNRLARQIAAALRSGHPFLRAKAEGLLRKGPWVELCAAANEQIEERKKILTDRAGQVGQLQAALKNMQEAVLIVDGRNQVILANEAFRRMFPHQGRGGSVDQAIPGGGLHKYVSRLRNEEEPGREEICFSRDGNELWAEVTGSRIHGSAEDNPLFLIVLHDITELRRLESIRQEFVANVSHELRTPLTMIKGYVETLVDEEAEVTEADRDRFLKIVHKHAQRLHALLEDILVLSRLERKDPERHFETVVIDELVAEVAENAQEALAQKGQTLTLKLGAGAAPVVVDASKITQVFQNLLENASKYSPAGASIEISTLLDEEKLHAWVQDTGPGIGEHDLPHIFERFYRVEKGRSREKGGTGLGLSIVKHIVQLHEGEVWVESRLGEGTRFGFWLPRALSAHPS